jgi:ABC-2 type transport system ATP-binding protein
MTPALEITGLRKRYNRTVALDGLDFKVPAGVICGLVGPNGAGKTTTFGVVGGLIRADAGRVDIGGRGPHQPGRHSGQLTLLPQDCELSPHVSPRQLLRYYARLQGMSRAAANRAADQGLDEVALSDRAASRLKELSHGMRRRVAVAQALLGEPDLVLLDEPTSGLDPALVVRMRELFAAQRGHRTLVLSSHNLLELEATCDHIVFIEGGRCPRSGSLAEVTQQAMLMRYQVERVVSLIALEQAAPELTLRWEGCSLIAQAPSGWTAATINGEVVPHLLAEKAGLLEIRQGKSLEDAYLAGAEG